MPRAALRLGSPRLLHAEGKLTSQVQRVTRNSVHQIDAARLTSGAQQMKLGETHRSKTKTIVTRNINHQFQRKQDLPDKPSKKELVKRNRLN